MAEFYELQKRYESIPLEMRTQRRWICYVVRDKGNESIKIPMSPKGDGASSEDESAWDDFDNALRYCADKNLTGVGFEFKGSGFVGIDLKNKKDENGNPLMSEKDFRAMTNDFVKTLNSYTEWSVSNNGIHIIIKGSMPRIENLNGNIEIHSTNRYFAMTGNSIGKRGVSEKSAELEMLVSKYGKRASEDGGQSSLSELRTLTDAEVMERAVSHKSGHRFKKLFDGDTSDYPSVDDARKALCNFLAYFSNCDTKQVDRMFRESALFDEQWEYDGDQLVQAAIERCAVMLTKGQEKKVEKVQPKSKNRMNLDENGDPIFYIPNDLGRKYYKLDDTGNAQMFHDYFGDNFRWNSNDKLWMFWTGKTWVYDTKDVIRQYANKLIEIIQADVDQLRSEIEYEASDEKKKKMYALLIAKEKNLKHLSNKSGKDAMLTEFHALGKTAVVNDDFNKHDELLNTDSGVVNLRTGEIEPWDKDLMMSMNTNVKVSFEKAETWERFIYSIFDYHGDEKATAEIVECFQRFIGYAFTGLTLESILTIFNGGGSNGKTTLCNVIKAVSGDYYATIDSNQLMCKKNQTVQVQNSMAELDGKRVLLAAETDDGERLSEKTVKEITGGDSVNAQKKFGRPYNFTPKFKPIMMTNNMPIIRGKDFGIWRRIFIFSFKKCFTEAEKDKMLPKKLEKEYPQILGWIIKGSIKYLENLELKQPDALKQELASYKKSVDTVAMFMDSECRKDERKCVAKNDLFAAYAAWCADSKLPAMSKPKFMVDMNEKGYTVELSENSGTQYFNGLELLGGNRTGKYVRTVED